MKVKWFLFQMVLNLVSLVLLILEVDMVFEIYNFLKVVDFWCLDNVTGVKAVH